MANTREPYFVKKSATAWGAVQVDKDIYDGDVAPALGLTKTAPPDTADTEIYRSHKDLLRTGKVARVYAQCTRDVSEGGETVTKRRSVPLLCAIDKLGTAMVQLKGKTVKLGDQNLTWEIQNVTFGS
jgi:hypothetical protein